MKHAKRQYQVVKNRTNLKTLRRIGIHSTEQVDRIAAMLRSGAKWSDALYATKEKQ